MKLSKCNICNQNKVFEVEGLPNICEDCLPNGMCENCNSFNIQYSRTVAGGDLLRCGDCYHEQYQKVQNG